MLVGYPKNATGVPMRHFPLRELGYAIGFIVLLTALYVGAYYATVERRLGRVIRGGKGSSDSQRIFIGAIYAKYPMDWLNPFFSPMYDLDLRMRPDFWSAEAMNEEIIRSKSTHY
jgi:hypothetical protein